LDYWWSPASYEGILTHLPLLVEAVEVRDSYLEVVLGTMVVSEVCRMEGVSRSEVWGVVP